MKKYEIIAWILFIIGIALGLYLCVYVMLYGGIMQIINHETGRDVAIGILKIVFCELGIIPSYLIFTLGGYIADKEV